MAAAGFGFGLGLQGAPREHTSIYMQRKQQEAAAAQQAALLKRKQAEEDEQMLEQFMVKEDVDYKLKPKAQQTMMEAYKGAMENQKKYPLTSKNKNIELLMEAKNVISALKEQSVPYKDARKKISTGKFRTSPTMLKHLNTEPGNHLNAMDGTEILYGMQVNPETGELTYTPVPKINVEQEIKRNIFSQTNAFDLDPNPIIVGGQKVRKTTFNQRYATAEYNNMYTDAFKRNVEIDYLEHLKSTGQYNPDKVVTPDNSISPKFETDAYNWGLVKMLKAGAELKQYQNLSKDININIDTQGGHGTDHDNDWGPLAQAEILFTDKNAGPAGADGKETAKQFKVTAWQSRFGAMKMTGLDSGGMINTDENEHIPKGKGRDIEVGQFAVMPVYKKVPGRTDAGLLVSDEQMQNPNIWNKQQIEYVVFVTGKGDNGSGRRDTSMAIPLKEAEALLRQQAKANREKLGKVWDKNDKEKLDATIKELYRMAEEQNADLPDFIDGTIVPSNTPAPAPVQTPPAGNGRPQIKGF